MTRFSAQLGSLLAVAAATVEENGTLVWANAGFLRLVSREAAGEIGAQVAVHFIQPAFASLAGAPPGIDGEVHRGLLTMGDFGGRTQSLRGRVWREGALLQVLAEYDIDEMERLNDTMLALNNGYASAQLELAQANLGMQQLNALLQRQKAELQATLDRVKRLEGLLPICMYCKKIRTENDDWQQVERYVADHSEAIFSHGMCPACFEEQMKNLEQLKTPQSP